jgi:hypothetical protein
LERLQVPVAFDPVQDAEDLLGAGGVVVLPKEPEAAASIVVDEPADLGLHRDVLGRVGRRLLGHLFTSR